MGSSTVNLLTGGGKAVAGIGEEVGNSMGLIAIAAGVIGVALLSNK